MSNPRSKLIQFALRGVPPLVLCGALLAQAAWFRSRTSITFDETYYLSTALQTVHDRQLDRRFAAGGVAPLSTLLSYAPAILSTGGVARVDEWKGLPGDPPLVQTARATSTVLYGIPLVVAVYCWLAVRRGTWAGVVAGGLCALSPTLVAHASLATTDIPFVLFAVVALALIAYYLRQPGWQSLVLVAAAVALAFSAKYSAVFLVPLACVAVAAHGGTGTGAERRARRLWRGAARVALFLLLTPLFIWLLQGFATKGPLKSVPAAETPDDSPWARLLGKGPAARAVMDFAHEHVPMPAPLAGLLAQIEHVRRGHAEAPAFLMGSRSRSGWWYYFPLALIFKSTPAELALMTGLFAACVLGMWRVVRGKRSWAGHGPATDAAPWLWAGSIVLFLALAIRSPLYIGQRHVLLLYPLVILLGVDLLSALLRPRPGWLSAAGAALLGSQAISAVWIAPDYLSYFNAFCGGPKHGYQLLVDSNVDWGQDLPSLRQALESLNCRRVLLEYFGTADPSAYGIENYVRFDGRAGAIPDGCDCLAISVTQLQGAYARQDYWRELRELRPAARASYSIMVYDLEEPRVRAAVEAALGRTAQPK